MPQQRRIPGDTQGPNVGVNLIKAHMKGQQKRHRKRGVGHATGVAMARALGAGQQRAWGTALAVEPVPLTAPREESMLARYQREKGE
jgi:hypothetical protein